MGMAVMAMKLDQELVSVDLGPPFLVFIDLRKAYATMDRGRLIQTLEGYGMGPCLCVLLVTLWSHQKKGAAT